MQLSVLVVGRQQMLEVWESRRRSTRAKVASRDADIRQPSLSHACAQHYITFGRDETKRKILGQVEMREGAAASYDDCTTMR